MVRPSDVRVEERTRSRVDRVVDLLAEYKIGVYICLLGAIALLITGRWQIPSLPAWAERTLLGITIGIIPSILLGKTLIVDRFLPDRRLRVLVVDPDNLMSCRALRVGRNLWETRETGEFRAFEPGDGNIDYVVTELDYRRGDEDGQGARLRVEGCNDEIANPLDVIATQGKLNQVYQDLLERDAELTRTEATIEAKTLEIDRENVNALITAVEHGTKFETNPLDVIRADEFDSVDDVDDPDVEEPDPDDRATLAEVLSEDVDPRIDSGSNPEASADD
jgi:hypothetical protein